MRTTNMDQKDGGIPEGIRRTVAGLLMWAGWLVAAIVFAWASIAFNPAKGEFAPQWVGFTFIGSLCIAIAGTLVRSRMRLQDTIIQAFTIGTNLAQREADLEHQELRALVQDVIREQGRGNGSAA